MQRAYSTGLLRHPGRRGGRRSGGLPGDRCFRGDAETGCCELSGLIQDVARDLVILGVISTAVSSLTVGMVCRHLSRSGTWPAVTQGRMEECHTVVERSLDTRKV